MTPNFERVQLDIIAKALFILASEHDLEMPEDTVRIFTQVLEDDVYRTDITDVVDVLEEFKSMVLNDEKYGIREGVTI